jgi:hypothetical protein
MVQSTAWVHLGPRLGIDKLSLGQKYEIEIFFSFYIDSNYYCHPQCISLHNTIIITYYRNSVYMITEQINTTMYFHSEIIIMFSSMPQTVYLLLLGDQK